MFDIKFVFANFNTKILLQLQPVLFSYLCCSFVLSCQLKEFGFEIKVQFSSEGRASSEQMCHSEKAIHCQFETKQTTFCLLWNLNGTPASWIPPNLANQISITWSPFQKFQIAGKIQLQNKKTRDLFFNNKTVTAEPNYRAGSTSWTSTTGCSSEGWATSTRSSWATRRTSEDALRASFSTE